VSDFLSRSCYTIFEREEGGQINVEIALKKH